MAPELSLLSREFLVGAHVKKKTTQDLVLVVLFAVSITSPYIVIPTDRTL